MDSNLRDVKQYIGRTITNIRIEVDDEGRKEDSLLIEFEPDEEEPVPEPGLLRLYDGGQQCCEYRHMHTDDLLEYFIQTIFLGVEVKEGPEEDGADGYQECAFLVVRTSLGEFTVANYNEHNGYYGGFWLVAQALA